METAITKMESLTARRLMILALIGEYTAKGFGNCENVARLKKELAAIQYDKYAEKYPGYIFFTDEQFNDIVSRNKLVTSTTNAYTGNIPDHCFEAIKNENISPEDYRENSSLHKVTFKTEKSSYRNYREDSFSDNWISFSMDLNADEAFRINSIGGVDSAILFVSGKTGRSVDYIHRKIHGSYYCDSYPNSIGKDVRINIEQSKAIIYEGLHIAAPKKFINTDFNPITKLFSKVIVAPKDPIVFRYVKNGVLVITFWK
jgi:hypothetical protein